MNFTKVPYSLEEKCRLKKGSVDENIHQTPSRAKPPHSQSFNGVVMYVSPSLFTSKNMSLCIVSECKGIPLNSGT